MNKSKILIFLASAALLMPVGVSAQHSVNLDLALEQGTTTTATGALGKLTLQGGRLLLVLPKEYVGRDFLMSSCIARTTNYKWMEVGTRNSVRKVQIVQEGDAYYLKNVDATTDGNPKDSASLHSLKDNHMDGYLARLPIVNKGKTGGGATLDITDVFLGDDVVKPFPWYRKTVGAKLDKSLSRIMGYKIFDDNLSVRVLYSYRYPAGDDGPGGVCSAEAVGSMLLLPKDKMRPRIADSRIGLFTVKKTLLDFGESDFYRSANYVERWRVEPSDYAAWSRGETVKPVKPIVYYIDNEFPERWKEPLRRGILSWNKAFESIGLKDVVQVRDYPVNDPDFDEDNLKYSCIRYVPTDRGGAQGPSWSDPETGELHCASVYVWASMIETMNRFCFTQTAQVNPSIRGGRMSDKDLSTAIECIISHEIGHTLGLAHNMGASAAYPVDSLLNADFVRRNGLTPSVMDYIYYNYVLPPGRTDVPYAQVGPGAYDRLAIEFIYRPTDPKLTPQEDMKITETWLDRHAGDPVYRYGVQQWAHKYDPSTLIDDISDDALRAGDMGISNLKYILKNMPEWLGGSDRAVIRRDMYKELVKQYTRYLDNAVYNIGGLKLWFVRDDTQGRPYQSLPRDRQKAAMAWVAEKLHSSDWIDDRTITARYAPAVDASACVEAQIAADLVAQSDKVVLSAHLADAEPYTIQDYTDDIYDLYFAAPARQKALTRADKTLQRALLQAVLKVIDGKDNSSVFPASKVLSDDAATGFLLDSEGGFLKHVDVEAISERKACFIDLVERVAQLAETQAKKASDTDRPHWKMLKLALEQSKN